MTGALEELNEVNDVEAFDLETLAFEGPRVAIDVRELRKSYGALEAVKGVGLEIRAGEIFGLIGPDGAGKTSVFQILGGVMAATEGAAEMYGVSARAARPFVGYLTQTFSLYQDMTVLENLRYIGELRRLPRAHRGAGAALPEHVRHGALHRPPRREPLGRHEGEARARMRAHQ